MRSFPSTANLGQLLDSGGIYVAARNAADTLRGTSKTLVGCLASGAKPGADIPRDRNHVGALHPGTSNADGVSRAASLLAARAEAQEVRVDVVAEDAAREDIVVTVAHVGRQDHAELLLPVDEPVGGGPAAPAASADARRVLCLARVLADGPAEAEAPAGLLEAKGGARVRELMDRHAARELVRHHRLHGVLPEDALAVQLAAVGEHLHEAHVVTRRADETAAAGLHDDAVVVDAIAREAFEAVHHLQPRLRIPGCCV